MVRYEGSSYLSYIKFYDINDEYIDIQFRRTPFVYRYSYVKPGKEMVEEMKKLAIKGAGLDDFIKQYVYSDYELKISFKEYYGDWSL